MSSSEDTRSPTMLMSSASLAYVNPSLSSSSSWTTTWGAIISVGWKMGFGSINYFDLVREPQTFLAENKTAKIVFQFSSEKLNFSMKAATVHVVTNPVFCWGERFWWERFAQH